MNSYSTNFKFCPQCRRPLKTIVNGLIDCQNCGFHFYLKPALTTTLIMENSRGEILLTKRKFPPKKNFWETPGGFINFGETAEECLRREIKEELGFILKEIRFFGSYWSYYPYRRIRYQTLCLVFLARYQNQPIIIKDDVKDFRFTAKKDVDLKKISFGDVRNALKDYLSSFK